MNRWVKYNANPLHNRTDDCTIRAISKAMGQSWDDTFDDIVHLAKKMAQMPDANIVWGRYLKRNGFHQYIVDDYGDDFYTVEEFARDHPYGIYILHMLDQEHVVAVIDGMYYDSFDSGNEVPQFYWTREL